MDDATRDHMGLLRGRVLRLENLIAGILAYSRAGRERGGHAADEVAQLAHEVWELLAPPESAELVVADPLPTLNANRVQLQQVQMNLIGNAIKYNTGHALTIELSARREREHWVFTIADNGIGIAPELHERIWGCSRPSSVATRSRAPVSASPLFARSSSRSTGAPGSSLGRGEFGADLYQRLAIVRIELPPLRDRTADIPELTAHLIARFYREEPRAPHRVTTLTASALAALQRYPWPGNVRELRNVVFQALVNKRAGDDVLLSDLPEQVVRGAPADRRTTSGGLIDRGAIAKLLDEGQMNLRSLRDDLERTTLELALARSGGSPSRVAGLLGEVGRGASRDPAGTVRAMLRRHGLD